MADSFSSCAVVSALESLKIYQLILRLLWESSVFPYPSAHCLDYFQTYLGAAGLYKTGSVP